MKFNSAKFSEDWVKQHHSYERYAYGKFKKALDEQVKGVVSHVKLYGGISATTADMLIRKSSLETAYRDVYKTIGVRSASVTRKWINSVGKSVKAANFFSETWARLMDLFYHNEAAQRVSDVTETTREKVRNVLADSADLPISQQATYIVDTLDDPAFNRNRALVIARTETTTAANKGASLGNEDADYETNKQWISIEDANTRPTHTDADGQIVANDDDFIVGGYSAPYPGAMNLPAKEVVNCRCTAAYVPVIRGGLPVLKI